MDEVAAGLHAGRKSGFLLTVVIPCFNEEAVIRATYERVSCVLGFQSFRLQMIFVDDGSVDRTGDILNEIAASDGRVFILAFSRNFGHQAAVSAGLTHSDGDATVVIDADLQDPPDVVLRMLKLWGDGYDVVYGVRRKRKEAYWKKIGYSLFYRLFAKLASIEAPLDAGDFSLLDKSVLAEINKLPEKNRFFRGLRAWVGFRQTGVEYERDPRFAGSSKYSFLKLLKLASDGIFNFSTVPLSLVFYIGMFVSVSSLIMLSLVLFLRITEIPILGIRVSDVQGFASIIITLLFIGGVQLIGMGIIGEYIGRIYQEVKARPTFVSRSRIDSGGMDETGASHSPVTHRNQFLATPATRGFEEPRT
jgi:glycosyltransferase involved in cell wall biosynthesis